MAESSGKLPDPPAPEPNLAPAASLPDPAATRARPPAEAASVDVTRDPGLPPQRVRRVRRKIRYRIQKTRQSSFRRWLKPVAAITASIAVIYVTIEFSGILEHPALTGVEQQYLAAIEDELLDRLGPRRSGQKGLERAPSAKQQAQLSALLDHGNVEQALLAKIALGNEDDARRAIESAKGEAVSRLVRVLLLEGHYWYGIGDIQRAAGAYEAALQLDPDDPALLRTAALAHTQIQSGDRDGHWRRALALLESAEHRFPAGTTEWCESQNDLARAWIERPNGDLGENIERAIALLQRARDHLHCFRDPRLRIRLQSDMGLAWLRHPSGDRIGNLQNAVALFSSNLRELSSENQPLEWVQNQKHLGLAWLALAERNIGNPGESQEKALAALTAASSAPIREDFPEEWAEARIKLALALSRLPTGDPVTRHKRAITLLQDAASVYERARYPERWAELRYQLADTLKQLAETGARNCNFLSQSMAYLKSIDASLQSTGGDEPRLPASLFEQRSQLRASLLSAWQIRHCGEEKTLTEVPAAK